MILRIIANILQQPPIFGRVLEMTFLVAKNVILSFLVNLLRWLGRRAAVCTTRLLPGKGLPRIWYFLGTAPEQTKKNCYQPSHLTPVTRFVSRLSSVVNSDIRRDEVIQLRDNLIECVLNGTICHSQDVTELVEFVRLKPDGQRETCPLSDR